MTTRLTLPYSTDPAVKPAWYYNARGDVMVRCQCGICAAVSAPITQAGEVELQHEELENGGCGWHTLATLERYP